MAAAGWIAGALVLGGFVSLRSALAFALVYALVAADFLWMARSLGILLGERLPTHSEWARLAVGMVLKTLLLAGVLYAILKVLPRESLGVVLGIGGPLMLLALAGALRTRG
jgi:hypothetical protein